MSNTAEKIKENICAEISKLTVYFENNCTALKDVNVKVYQGEHLCLMGASGSGKTTLLKCIAKQIIPDYGNINCDLKVAFIYQDLRLVKSKSVLENVLHGVLNKTGFVKSLCGFSRQDKQHATELIKSVGLEHKLNSPVSDLSGGEQQRVAIARALLQKPDILLADEPVSALDELNAHSIMKLLKKIASEKNLTIISVQHDRILAELYADRIIHLSDAIILKEEETGNVKTIEDLIVNTNHEPSKKVAKSFRPSVWKKVFAPLLILICLIGAIAGLKLEIDSTSEIFASLGAFVKQLLPGSWGEIQALPWGTLFYALYETILMAFVGTVFGALISWPLAALAAFNTSPKLIRTPIRFLLNAIRTVPSLIWALLFVAAVGLGKVAGIMALTAYSIGYLTKFFYEAFEGVDSGAPSALKEIGASGTKRFFHAVWPASKVAIYSSCFFMLEYNVRSAALLGIVDAGGIGFYIKQYLDIRYFPAVMASLFLILLVVLVLDQISTQIRKNTYAE